MEHVEFSAPGGCTQFIPWGGGRRRESHRRADEPGRDEEVGEESHRHADGPGRDGWIGGGVAQAHWAMKERGRGCKDALRVLGGGGGGRYARGGKGDMDGVAQVC